MSPSPATGKSVLCVDDTPYVLQMLEMFLSAVGYHALTASNGREAIQLASNFALHAVILDYEMPELSGLDVARILKQEHPHLPILMYSARQPQTEISAAGLVDGYVEKEHPQALVMELARLLGDPPPVLIRRRFPRYAASSPFSLRLAARDSHGEVTLQGTLRDLAEGGFGGVIDGKMVPGEVAALVLGIPQWDAQLEVQARVRYRNADSHGFEFIDVTPEQQQALSRCLKALSTQLS
jgi:CheY-like chemotaxis protein